MVDSNTFFNSGDIVCVLIPNAVNTGYDYRLDAPAPLGTFVRVRVQNRPYIGVIVRPGVSALSPDKIKPVEHVFTAADLGGGNGEPGLTPETLQWLYKMSDWTMMAPGAVLRLILNTPDAFVPPKTEPAFALCETAGKPFRMTKNRQAVIDAFAENPGESLSAADISQIARVSPAVVHAMIKNGILEQVSNRNLIPRTTPCTQHYFDTGTVKLNAEQQSAANAIELGGFGVHLLDGITGSGKTQVYFDTAIRTYNAGRSVLLLMPEIALTAQFRRRFADRFGAQPTIWHSNLTAARRRDIWRGVAMGAIRMVVGTRSALFLPWRDLGLIVVDEEHDTSYKQEDMGNYHARDMAILRGAIEKFPIVLASATPSAETMKKVADGAYKCSRLTSRFGGAAMPVIETIDMRKEKCGVWNAECENDNQSIAKPKSQTPNSTLSPTLCVAIAKTLKADRQVMLFINRRGYAPITQCKKCGWVATCPDCSVGMTWHKKPGKLLCHCCGRTMPLPHICPDCAAADISISGTGVEKIAAEVADRWPNARQAIVSSDTMMSRQALERLVSQMESGEINIVIGTQILAKGHHFPNLTLVGVVDADMGLFGTDFRAGERTFQQLFQVAGRAGRGEHPGRVLLQTYQPEHPVLRAIVAGDRDALMKMDLNGRRAAGMPPYGQLIAVIVEGPKETALQKFCAELAAKAPRIAHDTARVTSRAARIMGPIPAQIYQIRNRYRMRFLVSGPERAALQPVVAAWLARTKVPANIKIKIDVNPQSFM